MFTHIDILIKILLLPIAAIVLVIWLTKRRTWKDKSAVITLASIWLFFIGLLVLDNLLRPYFRPMIVTQDDIHGSYVIDRDKFPGAQADWQYNNFRLHILPNDKLVFEYRVYDNYWKSEIVDVSYSSGYYNFEVEDYCNRKIRVHSDSSNHHIIRDNPTLYRLPGYKFYYVFESEKFGNVFFKKGTWHSLD